jgi:two-component system KDP operon response regulator KdpE
VPASLGSQYLFGSAEYQPALAYPKERRIIMKVGGVRPLVLVVDDEPGMLKLVDLVLTNSNFRVITAGNGVEALHLLETRRPDVVLLDVRMPDTGGIDLMHDIHERARIPVILLTAQTGEESRANGLDSGADDYIVKPFSPIELSARVRTVLRRAHHPPGNGTILCTDGVEIDLDRRIVRKHGEIITLTRTEWRLLQELAANAGRVMLNEELLQRIWGQDFRGELQYLRVWISRLRAKLEDEPGEPKIITTFPGIGYMLKAGNDVGASI